MVQIIEFFIISFVLDYLVVLAQKSLFKLSVSNWYLLALQLLNISAGIIYVFCNLEFYQFILIKIFVNVVIALLITDSYRAKSVIALILSYLIFSFAEYGFTIFFIEFLKAVVFEIIGIKLQEFYNLTLFFAQLLFIYAIFTLISSLEDNKKLKKYLSKVSFSILGKHIEVTGLLDSGNSLYDTKTGKAVVIVSTSILKKILSHDEYKDVLCGDYSALGASDSVEYVTVGGTPRDMPIIRDVMVKVFCNGEACTKCCSLGFVNQTFGTNKFECLVHKDFV